MSTLVAVSPFDALRHLTPNGREYWSARDLMTPFGYGADWRNFAAAINRAKMSCHNSGTDPVVNFVGATKITGTKPDEDYHLSRYSCYLVALNGDPRKPEIAAAQTYFVIKTREAETATAAPALTGTDLLAAAVLEAQRMIEAKDAQIAELSPKADLADTYLTAQGGSRLIREAGKLLGMREREFRQWLKRDAFTDRGSRNPGDVWEIPTQPFPGAHFATMPTRLAQRCIAAGCKPSGTVLDPFSGSGTTGMVAQRLGRKYIGIDLNAEYLELSLRTRLHAAPLDFEAGA